MDFLIRLLKKLGILKVGSEKRTDQWKDGKQVREEEKKGNGPMMDMSDD